jgi:hypothetical protein
MVDVIIQLTPHLTDDVVELLADQPLPDRHQSFAETLFGIPDGTDRA